MQLENQILVEWVLKELITSECNINILTLHKLHWQETFGDAQSMHGHYTLHTLITPGLMLC